MVENLILSKNLLPRLKNHVELPNPLLENRGVVNFGLIFLRMKCGNPKLLHNEMFLIHYFIQIKLNFCIFIEFCCSGPFIVKVIKLA